jgi:putative endonuclease
MNISHKYKIDFGKRGEKLAVDFLVDKGFTIVEMNFRFGRSGEIDIIAKRDNLLIFVEVKRRSMNSFGGPLYSISGRKKKTLKATASNFLTLNPEYSKLHIICRYDMIYIMDNKIEWLDDIFR